MTPEQQNRINNIINWQRIFADNSDLNDNERGIIAFSRIVFPEHIDAVFSVAPIHREMYKHALMLYDPEYRFLPERQLQLIVFRGASKSTTMLGVFAAYIVCMNGHNMILPNGKIVKVEEDVICISSETGTFAENWTTRLRASLASKPWIREIYGSMRRGKLQDEEGKWQLGNFTIHKNKLPYPYTGRNCAVIARGTGQQIRGINLNGRVTLWLPDDIYSKNNIKTVEGRQNVRYWFNAESKNSLDQNKGKVISIGTMVHEDTVVMDNKKMAKNNRFWKCVEYPVMDLGQFQEVVSKYCTVNLDTHTCLIPNAEECYNLEQKGYNTNWPKKFPLELVLMKYAEAIEGSMVGAVTMFYQEYFHITLAEEDKNIKRNQMQDLDFELLCERVDGQMLSWVKVGTEYRHVNTMIAIDAAGSTQNGADPTALVFVAMDFYGRVYIHRSQSGRYAVVDEYSSVEEQKRWFGKLTPANARDSDGQPSIKRIGSADEMFRWIGEHRCEIAVEIQATIGHEIVRQIYAKMALYGIRRTVYEVPATTKKEERIVQTLSPHYQSFSVFHRPGQTVLKDQLEMIGKMTHDDEADALEIAVSRVRKPNRLIEYKRKEESVKLNHKVKMLGILQNYSEVDHKNVWKTI